VLQTFNAARCHAIGTKWGEAMSAEVPGSTQQPARAGWREWLRLCAAALVLLALSEALWVWQTWPVRELLHSAATLPAGR
jgi:hypothetical protein